MIFFLAFFVIFRSIVFTSISFYAFPFISFFASVLHFNKLEITWDNKQNLRHRFASVRFVQFCRAGCWEWLIVWINLDFCCFLLLVRNNSDKAKHLLIQGSNKDAGGSWTNNCWSSLNYCIAIGSCNPCLLFSHGTYDLNWRRQQFGGGLKPPDLTRNLSMQQV